MPEPLVDVVAAGSPLTGTFLTLPGATAAELLAEPFDLVLIDLEHGALGPFEAQEMILGAQAAGTYALVRLPADAYALMTAVLDAGADGVVLADVGSAVVAAAAVERISHPPDGIRGWGPRRSSLRQRRTGRRPPRPSLWVQIESTEGVAEAAAIASVPGVDVLLVGTSDLSFSVGTPLDTHAPQVLEAVAEVRAAADAVGVAFGVAGALDLAPPEARAGASILVHSTDARLCAGAVDGIADWLSSTLHTDRQEADLA
jgi:4-hydroxy-2-oxoheptanedioate aldolase